MENWKQFLLKENESPLQVMVCGDSIMNHAFPPYNSRKILKNLGLSSKNSYIMRYAIPGNTVGMISRKQIPNALSQAKRRAGGSGVVVVVNGGINNAPGCGIDSYVDRRGKIKPLPEYKYKYHKVSEVKKVWGEIASKVIASGQNTLVIVPIFKTVEKPNIYRSKFYGNPAWYRRRGQKRIGSKKRPYSIDEAINEINAYLKTLADNKRVFYVDELENTTADHEDGLHYTRSTSFKIAQTIINFVKEKIHSN